MLTKHVGWTTEHDYLLILYIFFSFIRHSSYKKEMLTSVESNKDYLLIYSSVRVCHFIVVEYEDDFALIHSFVNFIYSPTILQSRDIVDNFCNKLIIYWFYHLFHSPVMLTNAKIKDDCSMISPFVHFIHSLIIHQSDSVDNCEDKKWLFHDFSICSFH